MSHRKTGQKVERRSAGSRHAYDKTAIRAVCMDAWRKHSGTTKVPKGSFVIGLSGPQDHGASQVNQYLSAEFISSADQFIAIDKCAEVCAANRKAHPEMLVIHATWREVLSNPSKYGINLNRCVFVDLDSCALGKNRPARELISQTLTCFASRGAFVAFNVMMRNPHCGGRKEYTVEEVAENMFEGVSGTVLKTYIPRLSSYAYSMTKHTPMRTFIFRGRKRSSFGKVGHDRAAVAK